MGSGGSYIGYLVAKRLGFKYIDREILHQAAEKLGTQASQLQEHDERSCGPIDNLLQALIFGTPEAAYVPSLSRPVYDKDLFTLESRIMRRIAGQYNAVIAGRAGFHVLRDLPGAIHLFIHAPAEFRIDRVMKAQRITEAGEARRKLKQSDQRRSKFVRDMTGLVWTDARNFHLCINAGVIGFDASVELIIGLVNRKKHPSKT